MDRDKLLDLCRRALAAARPYVLDGRGSWEDSRKAGVLLDEALAELGTPHELSDWDGPSEPDSSNVIALSGRAATPEAK